MSEAVNTAIDGVETALKLIKVSSGYNFNLGNPDELIGPESVDEVTGAAPRVYIVAVDDEVERFSPSKLFKKVSVTIRGITKPSHWRDVQQLSLKLWSDIEKAIYSDKTLGGAVTTLRYLSGTTEFQRESGHGVVELVFELDIHYTEGTP